jgi:hypothetical protein
MGTVEGIRRASRRATGQPPGCARDDGDAGRLPLAARTVLATAVGLVVGAGTSLAQTLLGDTPVAGLANAVSPWVVAPFVLGATALRRGPAAVLGAVAVLLFASLGRRGHQHAAVLAWLVPAVLLGVAGMLALHAP